MTGSDPHAGSRAAELSARSAVLWTGIGAFVLGLATVSTAAALHAVSVGRLSFTSTFLSVLGASESPWARTAFNSGLLVLAPVRLAFLLLVARRCRALGVSRHAAAALALFAVLVCAGEVGVAAVPYTLDEAVHEAAAVIYYTGWMGVSLTLALVTLARSWPGELALASAALTISCAVFLALLASGHLPGTDGAPAAVVAEWCSVAAMLAWMAVTTGVFARDLRPRAAHAWTISAAPSPAPSAE